MQNFILEGIGEIHGGEYDTISIEGVANCSNSIKANSIHVEGVFNCSGAVEAIDLYCEGVADFKSNIRAKRMTVEGVLSMKGDSKIEAEEIICEGVIKRNGEISTDIMRAEGCIVAKEIVGDQIRIYSHYKVNRFISLFNRFKSDVKLIEATTIELSGVKAESVNGRDITIGPNCKINNLDCSGVLSIDRTSEVGTITGEYTKRY